MDGDNAAPVLELLLFLAAIGNNFLMRGQQSAPLLSAAEAATLSAELQKAASLPCSSSRISNILPQSLLNPGFKCNGIYLSLLKFNLLAQIKVKSVCLWADICTPLAHPFPASKQDTLPNSFQNLT